MKKSCARRPTQLGEPVWVFRVAATAADFPSGKAEPTQLGMYPIRRRQRRMRGNLPGPEGLARRGASAALHGLPVVSTTGGAARLASAPSPCQRGSREILRQAPRLLNAGIAGVPTMRPNLRLLLMGERAEYRLVVRKHIEIEWPQAVIIEHRL